MNRILMNIIYLILFVNNCRYAKTSLIISTYNHSSKNITVLKSIV